MTSSKQHNNQGMLQLISDVCMYVCMYEIIAGQ